MSDVSKVSIRDSEGNYDGVVEVYRSGNSLVLKDSSNTKTLAQILSAIVTDHGALTGLSDDDHTLYLRTDGARNASALTISGGELKLENASNILLGSTDGDTPGSIYLNTANDPVTIITPASNGTSVTFGDSNENAVTFIEGASIQINAPTNISDRLIFGLAGELLSNSNTLTITSYASHDNLIFTNSSGTDRIQIAGGTGTTITGNLGVVGHASVNGGVSIYGAKSDFTFPPTASGITNASLIINPSTVANSAYVLFACAVGNSNRFSVDAGGNVSTSTLTANSLTISGASALGSISATANPTGSGVSQGTLYINPASATANYTLFGVAVNGAQKFKIDAEGDVTLNSITGLASTLNINATASVGLMYNGANQFSTGVNGPTTYIDSGKPLTIYSVPGDDSIAQFTVDGVYFNYPITSLLGLNAIPTGTGIASSTLYINPPSASANYPLLGVAVNGTEKFRVDAEGDTTIAGVCKASGGYQSADGTAGISGEFEWTNYSNETILVTVKNGIITELMVP